jgi:uroporphyrinogen decarboxylase
MNKIERVRAALAGKEVDHIPAGFWFHFPAEKAHGAASVKAHLEFYRDSGVDLLKVMNEHPYDPGLPIRTATDWRKIRPAPLSSPFFQELLDELKWIVDAVGHECLVITTIRNPLQANGKDTAGRLATEHLKEDPESVSAGLSVITESLAQFALACLEAGAAGIYYSAKGGEEGRFSEEDFLRYVLPHDRAFLSAIQGRGEMNVLHICGEQVRLHHYANCPSHVVNWAVGKNRLPLGEARKVFGRPILGGLDNRGVIVNGPDDAIRRAVHDVIHTSGPGPFLLGADCTLPTAIDVRNIRIAVEATAF